MELRRIQKSLKHIIEKLGLKLKLRSVILITILAGIIELMVLASIPAVIGILSETVIFQIPISNNVLIWFLGVLIIFRLGLVTLSNRISINFSWNLTHRLTIIVYEYYLKGPLESFSNNKLSRKVREVTGEVTFITQAIYSYINVVSEVIILCIVLIIALAFFPTITFFVIPILILGVLFNKYFVSPKIKRAGKSRVENERKMYDLAVSSFEVIRDIKISNSKNYYINRYREFSEKRINASGNHQFYSVIPKMTLETLVLTILWLLLYLTYSENIISINDFLTIIGTSLAIAFRLLPSISKTLTSLNNLKFNDKVITSYIELITNKPFTKPMCFFSSDEVLLKFKEVSYAYQNSSFALTIPHFEINRTETIGIVGSSGSGKSTFISLLSGLLRPIHGEIQFNKVLKRDRAIGLVDQRVEILDGNIYFNITLSQSRTLTEEKKVIELISLVGLYPWYEKLNAGLDTLINNQNSSLSGGQRQRIGLARALFNEPKLLILDEFTSGLDRETEKKLIDLLTINFSRKLSIVIISHNKKPLQICDRIIKIKDGQLCM